MKPQTAAAFERLAQVDWFSALGEDRDGPFVVVSSWEEALQHCLPAEWQDLILEAANRCSEAVMSRDKDRFRQWNAVAADVRSAPLPLIAQKVRPVTTAHGLPPAVETAVRWDLIHFALECEFANVFPPGFFASQVYWYVHGRFPCGSEGDFPAGKLVLY